MAPTFSSLDASSYQHPIRGGLFDILQEKTVAVMTERGIEYKTMSEHPISWADDQDPFRHVMGPNYANLAGNCFIRVLESFEEQLKDQYPDFMSGSRIGPMTNNYTMKISRVAKYPDTVCFHPSYPKTILKEYETNTSHGVAKSSLQRPAF